MALALQAVTFAQQLTYSWRHYVPKKKENALKLGVLSSANINTASIIHPASTHEDVILYAIASRDASSAASYASRHHFHKSYGSYIELLEDPEIDFVYISLPNSHHYEWVAKSLKAGKHVLVEKPFTSNEIEAEKLATLAANTGKILMEAFHWQFHPAAHRFREILDSGRLGRIIKTDATMSCTPAPPSDDIRWNYNLSGGSLMDMTYVLSFTRYALHAGLPDAVLYAKAHPSFDDPRVDRAMHATLRYRNGSSRDERNVYSTIYTDLARPWLYGIVPRFWELPAIRVETEHAEVYFYNAMMPHVYHYIGITAKDSGKTKYEQVYKGGPLWGSRGETHWSTYRYQLEAFVDKIRGKEPACWVSNEDSVLQMKTIDMIYRQSGMPLRASRLAAIQ